MSILEYYQTLGDEGHTTLWCDEDENWFFDEEGLDPYAIPEIKFTSADPKTGPHRWKPRADFDIGNGLQGSCWFEAPVITDEYLGQRVGVEFHLSIAGIMWNQQISMPLGNTLAHWFGYSNGPNIIYYDALECILCYFSSRTETAHTFFAGELVGSLAGEIDVSIAVCKDIVPDWWRTEMERLGWFSK